MRSLSYAILFLALNSLSASYSFYASENEDKSLIILKHESLHTMGGLFSTYNVYESTHPSSEFILRGFYSSNSHPIPGDMKLFFVNPLGSSNYFLLSFFQKRPFYITDSMDRSVQYQICKLTQVELHNIHIKKIPEKEYSLFLIPVDAIPFAVFQEKVFSLDPLTKKLFVSEIAPDPFIREIEVLKLRDGDEPIGVTPNFEIIIRSQQNEILKIELENKALVDLLLAGPSGLFPPNFRTPQKSSISSSNVDLFINGPNSNFSPANPQVSFHELRPSDPPLIVGPDVQEWEDEISLYSKHLDPYHLYFYPTPLAPQSSPFFMHSLPSFFINLNYIALIDIVQEYSTGFDPPLYHKLQDPIVTILMQENQKSQQAKQTQESIILGIDKLRVTNRPHKPKKTPHTHKNQQFYLNTENVLPTLFDLPEDVFIVEFKFSPNFEHKLILYMTVDQFFEALKYRAFTKAALVFHARIDFDLNPKFIPFSTEELINPSNLKDHLRLLKKEPSKAIIRNLGPQFPSNPSYSRAMQFLANLENEPSSPCMIMFETLRESL